MERYDQIYSVYEEFDAERLRAYQEFVDVFPAIDLGVALAYWEDASGELRDRKAAISERYPGVGDTLAEVAARATRQEAFTALDLLSKYDRPVNVLVLDVDETLRSAGDTDNEIPRRVLHLLTAFHERGLPIVICTGQTLENVKGFLIQGLGNELVHSGDLSVVYEAGTGVFTPGHGADTKQLLYERLDPEIQAVFEDVRSQVLRNVPGELHGYVHLQGNEFNVTLKPNFETGSSRAREVIDHALRYQLDLLGEAVGARVDQDGDATAWARGYYARADPEIRAALDATDALPGLSPDAVPEAAVSLFERIDVAYYEADAAEIGSRELNKVVGVEAALDVLGVPDPFALVMGDSKSDLRVMRWAKREDAGVAAAPEHASPDVLDHVRRTDDLVFDPGNAAEPLRTVYAMDCLAEPDET